jgi:hypothetical protein
LDSFVWIEYFHPKWDLSFDLQSLIEAADPSILITPEIAIYETAQVYGSSSYDFESFRKDLDVIKNASTIGKCTYEQTHKAGVLRRKFVEKNSGSSGKSEEFKVPKRNCLPSWVDCLLLAYAIDHYQKDASVKVMSGDPHFWDFSHPELCGKSEVMKQIAKDTGCFIPSMIEYIGVPQEVAK